MFEHSEFANFSILLWNELMELFMFETNLRVFLLVLELGYL